MQPRTLQQNSQLHKLLTETGLTDEKGTLVKEFTNSRTSSSSAMSMAECQALIDHLAGCLGGPVVDKAGRANQMRRSILAVAHQLRWELDGSTKVDMARVNEWCRTRSYLQKPLNDYTYEELPKLVSQINLVLADFLKRSQQPHVHA